MIRQFRVQNFKALRDVTLDLTPIHVLIGPNDSGKSSILQALQGLGRSMDHPISDAFVGEWTGRELINVNSKGRSATFSIIGDDLAGPIEYELKLDFHDNKRKAVDSQERLFVHGSQCALPEFHNDQTRLSRVLRESSNPASATFQDAQAAEDAFTPVAYLALTAHHLRLPSTLRQRSNLDRSGFGLPAVLDTFLSEDRARFDSLEERLRGIFPEVESIQLPHSDAYDVPVDPESSVPGLKKSPGKRLRFRFKDQSRPVPASQVSDGILYTLAYLVQLYLPYLDDSPRVLLIEEPENGLHPERLSQITKILRELIAKHPQTQILMTTHAPYLVDEFEPKEVTVCYRDTQGDVKVRRLDRSPLVERQRDIFNLGEIWAAEGEKALIEDPQEVSR